MWDAREQDDLRRAMALVDEVCERYGPELTEAELEALADLLLLLCGQDEEYPCGAEIEPGECPASIVLHSLEELALARVRLALNRPAPPPDSAPGIVQVVAARLLVAAGLTSRRRRVARLRLWGYSRAETAELLGLPSVTVDTEWRYAKTALRAALRRGMVDELPAPGVSVAVVREVDARELVRLEQGRAIYTAPTHCAVGREKCRTTGVCAFRGPRYGS